MADPIKEKETEVENREKETEVESREKETEVESREKETEVKNTAKKNPRILSLYSLAFFTYILFVIIYLSSNKILMDFLYENSIYIYSIIYIAIVTIGLFILKTNEFIYFITRLLAIFLFAITFSGVSYSILFYDHLPFEDATRLREAQVFLAVSSAGMMGGLMRYFARDGVAKGKEMNLWHMVHASITGLFVSIIFFLILRAGIINQTQIDTFNVWGITGVSAVTGFFSDRVIERFSNLYNEVIGKTEKPDRNA